MKQLRYFVAIVDERSISGAAGRLRIAQPALSNHVHSLEAHLGVQLLSRSAHGVRPTEAGAQLYERAQFILRCFEQAVEEVRGFSKEPRGAVAVGLPTSAASVLPVALVEAVRERLPRVLLRLTEGMNDDVKDWLGSGRLDLAMLFDVARSRALASEPMLTEGLYAVSPPGLDGDRIAFGELARLDLVMPSRPHGLRERVERGAREAGVALRVAAEVDSLGLVKALVARGVGSTVLPLSVVKEERDARTLSARLIVDPPLQRTVSLCHAKARPLSGAARAVRDVLRDVMRRLVAERRWPGKPLFAASPVP